MSDSALRPSDDPLHGNAPSDLLRAALEGEESPIPSSRASWRPPAPEELALLMPHYSITRLIGRGGMGAVYQGVQLSLSRDVAIKLLPPELGAEPEFEARFKREAMALGRLNHPNIVQIYDYGQTSGGHHYIVMEYVDGSDLQQLIRSGGLDVTGALNAVVQICGALDYAHGEGFVHRDIKPANIFINRKGVLKIGDFGLAKLVGSGSPAGNDADHLTRTDVVMGTLHYIAPEQLGGNDAIDHRADIFSLGVMFYEMLTGTVPRGAFRPPSERVRALDVRIDGIVFKSMEEDPDDRYQSAADLGAEVERIRARRSAGDPLPTDSSAPVVPENPLPSPPPRRGLMLATGAGLAVVAGIGLLAFPRSWNLPEESLVQVDDSTILPPPTVEIPWISLLPLVDPGADAVTGKWERVADGIQGSDPEKVARGILLSLPYEPPEEYDFRIVFTTHEGNSEARQILSASGRRFHWASASGQPEKWAGFERIGGMSISERAKGSPEEKVPGAKKLPSIPFSGVRHESVVEVRRDRVTGYVDGEMLVNWPTNFQEMFPDPQYSLPDPKVLGIGLHWCRTTFHDVSVREVAGKGTLLRKNPPHPSPARTTDDPSQATKGQPFINSLGMKFVPVPETGVLFCIHETRFRDYELYASENPGIADRWRNQTHDGYIITSRAADHPVTWVSWSETKAFCEWLGKREGREYRLPTDEEWSLAAGMIRRSGESISPGLPYPWGSQWPPPPWAGNYSDQSRKRKAPPTQGAIYLGNFDDGFPTTAPVMSFVPNGFGLHDLGGNVWEWVEDKEDENREDRLRRGGSWRLASEPDLRSSYRLSNEPTARDPIHGFRLVLVP